MTIQDVDKEFQKRVLKDMRLMEIRSRAKRGIATFADTAEYNDRISNILGSVLSGRMPSVPNVERVKLCEYMLRYLYNDTNEMCAAVQQTLDKANGIQITPQKAPFPAERVRKIAKSLTDPSVPENTIKRRAKAPVANVSKSFHDDYIRKNAAFRNDAGLDVYIVRMGTGCCKWCSEVSGKYKFGSQPDDIFRRHDNCDCTIIYDNQVLRGKKKSDGSRSKTWEEIPNAPDEYSPTVLSEQDGRELQQRNLSRFRGLTNSSDNDKIRNIRLDDVKDAVNNSKISENVAKTIFDALGEDNGQYLFDDVAVVQLDFNIVMQTDPVRKGTFFDTRLNLNENFLGGKTVKQLDEQMKNTDYTVANSLREAVIHEKYHAKLINGLNQSQLESLYDSLSDYHIDGISPTAWKDGSECIAEIGVLFERGETDDLPQHAKDLFNKYIGGI